MNTAPVRDYLLGLQDRIITTLQAEDGTPFVEDRWVREPGGRLEGDGLSRLVEEGGLLERGGCNFSHVKGPSLPASATAHRAHLAGAPFEAMGVSLVLHPRNPYVPTVHMNVRMLAAFPTGAEPVTWFGGGMDLTPYYGWEEDARHFHVTCRDALAPFGTDLHPRFKQWCDEYFFLKHRGEPRGVGGIFYDHHNTGDWEKDFAFTQGVGEAFRGIYPQIVRARMGEAWSDAERHEQAKWRGRYVEFNLLYDRGTTFGLKTGGNVDSILSSMPPVAEWP